MLFPWHNTLIIIIEYFDQQGLLHWSFKWNFQFNYLNAWNKLIQILWNSCRLRQDCWLSKIYQSGRRHIGMCICSRSIHFAHLINISWKIISLLLSTHPKWIWKCVCECTVTICMSTRGYHAHPVQIYTHLYIQQELQSSALVTTAGCSIPIAYHDDVVEWKHFPRYWLFVLGLHRSPVNSPHKASDTEL